MATWSLVMAVAAAGCAKDPLDREIESRRVYGAILNASAQSPAWVLDALIFPYELHSATYGRMGLEDLGFDREAFDDLLVRDGSGTPTPEPLDTDVAFEFVAEPQPEGTLGWSAVGFDARGLRAVVVVEESCLCDEGTLTCGALTATSDLHCGHYEVRAVERPDTDAAWSQISKAAYFFYN